MKKNRVILTWPLFVLALSLIIVAACGKKQWPQADVQEDLLHWKEINVTSRNNCLMIEAGFTGRAGNISQVVLLLEESSQTCMNCPFQATKKIIFTLPCPQVKVCGQKASIRYYPVTPDKSYRIQLIAVNIFSQLPSQRSPVVLVPSLSPAGNQPLLEHGAQGEPGTAVLLDKQDRHRREF